MDVLPVEMVGVSDAERRIIGPLLSGVPEKAIAVELKLSPHTVHSHIKRIYRKCRVKSRPELIGLLARRMSLIVQAAHAGQPIPAKACATDDTVIYL